LKQDSDALTEIYGDAVDVQAILGGHVAMPREAAAFVDRVAAAFPPARGASRTVDCSSPESPQEHRVQAGACTSLVRHESCVSGRR
jgi:hypothetical protein